MGLLMPVLTYDAIGSADIVIEAVFERWTSSSRYSPSSTAS